MALYNHPNFGDVQRFIFMKGIITSVDSENDTAGVTIPGASAGSRVPLFYHCSADSEERDNGAIEGAASAFKVDDEVIVMHNVEDDKAVRIIGFVDGIRNCGGGVVIVTSGQYCFVWNIYTNSFVTDVFINNAVPPDYDTDIGKKYVTEWPYHYYQLDHEFGPDLLSSWKASLEVWEGWELLFSEVAIEGNDPENYDNYTSLDGSIWNSTQYARKKNGLWLTSLNGSDYVGELSATVSWTAVRQTARTGPDEAGDYSCSGTQSCTASTNNTGSDYFTDVTNGSFSESCTSSDTGYIPRCWQEDADVYTCERSGSLLWSRSGYAYDLNFFTRTTYDNCSYYNENYGIIIQMFTCQKRIYDGGWVSHPHGYGTCNTDISNVVDTDDEEAIDPSDLTENTDLSAALQTLIEASEIVTISAIFRK